MATTTETTMTAQEIREAAEKRLKEIEPLVDEAQHLRGLIHGFENPDPGNGAVAPEPKPTPAPRGRGRSTGVSGGKTMEKVLAEVQKAGAEGISVSDLAKRLGKKQPNYLYRIVNTLLTEGAVRKQGNLWVATS